MVDGIREYAKMRWILKQKSKCKSTKSEDAYIEIFDGL